MIYKLFFSAICDVIFVEDNCDGGGGETNLGPYKEKISKCGLHCKVLFEHCFVMEPIFGALTFGRKRMANVGVTVEWHRTKYNRRI